MIRAAMLAAALAGPAQAHEWYDRWCCSDQDCAPIPGPAWTPDGWRVKLGPGDHPMMGGRSIDMVVPFDAARPSQDADWHACIVWGDEGGPVRCLYVPGSV